mmetsp:Transcript_24980/g.87051  ORF Transcript_24980/g.87051 Transcript_24980/m.87051 type:complete len:346 (-) Transcript_24980:4633-5670(-)
MAARRRERRAPSLRRRPRARVGCCLATSTSIWRRKLPRWASPPSLGTSPRSRGQTHSGSKRRCGTAPAISRCWASRPAPPPADVRARSRRTRACATAATKRGGGGRGGTVSEVTATTLRVRRRRQPASCSPATPIAQCRRLRFLLGRLRIPGRVSRLPWRSRSEEASWAMARAMTKPTRHVSRRRSTLPRPRPTVRRCRRWRCPAERGPAIRDRLLSRVSAASRRPDGSAAPQPRRRARRRHQIAAGTTAAPPTRCAESSLLGTRMGLAARPAPLHAGQSRHSAKATGSTAWPRRRPQRSLAGSSGSARRRRTRGCAATRRLASPLRSLRASRLAVQVRVGAAPV